MDKVAPYAKAWAAALAVVVLWVVHGVTTGDWQQTPALEAAVAAVIFGAVVYFVPNSE